MKFREAFKIAAIPVTFASLCCLSSVFLVLFGLSSISFAASLSDTLYYGYKWVFRGVGLLLLLASTAYYLYQSKGICTLDQAKKRRKEIINTTLIVVGVGIVGYIIFLDVIVHYAGVFLQIWE
ncbi:MAG: hypothetical protein O2840_02965 [bacterium]|nr:hypothetical protein [bacterium]